MNIGSIVQKRPVAHNKAGSVEIVVPPLSLDDRYIKVYDLTESLLILSEDISSSRLKHQASMTERLPKKQINSQPKVKLTKSIKQNIDMYFKRDIVKPKTSTDNSPTLKQTK